MPTRRFFLGATTAAALAPAAAAESRKPNLLFLMADDHAGYVLGADGNRQAVTPHLDRLAAEGTYFARHYCNSPVCTPSRQSILTGKLPHAAGVTVLRTALAEEQPTLAERLAAEGYQTAVFGKMHFNQPGKPGLHGFGIANTEDVVNRGWRAAVGPAAPNLPAGAAVRPVWKPFQDPARIWLNAGKLPFERAEEQMRSTWMAQQACRYLDEHHNDGDPFALWVSFQEPHSPFDFPLEDRTRFDPSRFAVPRVGPEDAGQIPLIFRDLTPRDKQGIIAAYYTSVAFLDRNIGRVLRKLNQLGLEKDTLVVYLPDHGYSLGQHGRFEKHCGYDPALRVPLILRWPGHVERGRRIAEFTESVDVAGAILHLLGLERGGASAPLPRRRASVFSEYLENEEAYVRTARWKLIHCSGRRARTDGYATDQPTPGRTVRLYDLQADPGEFHSVAAKHPEVVEHLSREMLSRFRATHPEAAQEPERLALADAIEFYLRPRDATGPAERVPG